MKSSTLPGKYVFFSIVKKLLLVVMVGCSISLPAFAASIGPADYASLAKEATTRKYVAVLVGLNIDIPLTERKQQAAKIAALESALVKSLGERVMPSVVWSNGIGQVGLLVTLEGLAQLAADPAVKQVVPDTGRSIIHDPYGHMRKIQESIDQTGSATVIVIQQLNNLEWGLGPRGESVFNFSPALESEFRQKAPAFLESLPPHAILNLADARSRAATGLPRPSAATASPEILLIVNQEGFHHLQARRDIRSLRMLQFEGNEPVDLDPRVIAIATRDGYASVIIALKMPAGYSAAEGYMSKRAWDAQVRSLRAAMVEIIGGVYPQAVPLIQHYDGLAGAHVVLPFGALRSMFDKPDPRVQSIRLNEPIAAPAMSRSLLNR